jgi:uncharacterized membrane protein
MQQRPHDPAAPPEGHRDRLHTADETRSRSQSAARRLAMVYADARPRNDLAMTSHTTSHTETNEHRRPTGLLHRWVLPRPIPKPVNPVLLKHAERRAGYAQNRVADAITGFAGSMAFVYIHVLWFGCWIAFGVEKYPFGLLTMIVSLEAIFLSTFVLISQNRADAKRQVIADQQWTTVQEEDEQNKKLLELSEQILAQTKEARGFVGFAQRDQNRTRSCWTYRVER